MGWNISYVLALTIGCLIMIFGGLGGDTWQYYAMCVIMTSCYWFGRARGENL